MNDALIPKIGIPEAAESCGVSQRTVRRWMKSGRLKFRKVGGRYRTTGEWIQQMSDAAPGRDPAAGEWSENDHASYAEAVRDLASTFGVGPGVPRAKMQAQG